MKVALFVPCFIDAFYPEVAVATLSLLERLGVDVTYPMQQTCCGQPMANSGAQGDAAGAERLFIENFAGFDYIVGPSASCVHHIRSHLTAIEQTDDVKHVRASVWELTEFLHDVLNVRDFPWAHFPHRVGLHNSCSALRHLKTASASEVRWQTDADGVSRAASGYSKPRTLLMGVEGIVFVEPARADECCGFGGSFSVGEEAVSVRMGQDKVKAHLDAGAEYIVSGDMSCLMHQQGCAERAGVKAKFIHIAQVLNGVGEDSAADSTRRAQEEAGR